MPDCEYLIVGGRTSGNAATDGIREITRSDSRKACLSVSLDTVRDRVDAPRTSKTYSIGLNGRTEGSEV